MIARRRKPVAVSAAAEHLEPRALLAATATQTALEQIQATGAQAFVATVGSSREQVIAVIDTGIAFGVIPAANVWVNARETPGDGIDNDANGFVDDVRGWDFGSNDNDPSDQHGHGTKVAGVILAVDPSVKIMALRVGDSSITNSAVRSAVNYVEMMRGRGVMIVSANMSIGGGARDEGIANLVAKSKVIYCGAAGNYATEIDGVKSTFYPASYTGVQGVAANVTGTITKAKYSNYGPGIAFSAPGSWTVKGLNGRLVTFAGTSAATPAMAASVSLAWRANVGASHTEVIASFQLTASPNDFTRWGLVNADGAARNLYAARAA